MLTAGFGNLLRSLEKSIKEPTKIQVIKGAIPKWVKGVLYRNGPGRFQFKNKRYNHLFDGQACIHKFQIANGEVAYSNRLLETKQYTKTIEENRVFRNFGTIDSEANLLKRIFYLMKPPNTNDNVNVNIVPYANKYLYALTETNRFCQLDPVNLDILDTVEIDNYIKHLKSTIAHPHVESDGSWITMGMVPRGKDGKPYYEFIKYKVDKNGKESSLGKNIQTLATLPSSHSSGLSYFHSFSLSKNYAIFFEQSLILSFKELFKTVIQNVPLSKALICDKNEPTRIHLINRHTGEIIKRKYVTDPQFTFHYINSYETETNEIYTDVCSYDARDFDVNNFALDTDKTGKLDLLKPMKSIAKRIRIPLGAESSNGRETYCEIKDINSNLAIELPTINYSKNNGLRYKYAYGVNIYKKPYSVVKLNMDDPKEAFEMKYMGVQNDANCLPTEPIFVENPNAISEDDGVLLVMVLAEPNDFLSILDAKNLNEIARAEFPTDLKAAFTFHGFFADNSTFSDLN